MGIEQRFAIFFRDVIGLSRIMDCFRDIRTNPVIPLHHIVGTILWMPFFGVRSLLAADGISRRQRMRELFATVKRKMVVSDTTIKRVLRWCRPQWSRQALLRLAAPLDQLQLLKRPLIHGGTPRRIGLIDGSYVGKQLCVCLTLLGRVRLPVMLESAGEGKELPVAYRMLKHAKRVLGSRSPELWLLDALYFTTNTFRRVRQSGAHVVLKAANSDFREVLSDANALFHGENPAVDTVPVDSGFDSERQCHWQMKRTSGRFAGFPVQVLWLHEHYPKRRTNHSVTTWIVTTKLDLLPAEIREAAHLRWQIENNVFKRMAHHAGTKRFWCRDHQTLMTLLRLFCAATAIFDAFTITILSADRAQRKELLAGVKPTWSNIFSQVTEHLRYGFLDRACAPPG